MKGVFLHILGDALGSIIVMISATAYLTIPRICADIVSTTVNPVITSIASTNGTTLSNMSVFTLAAETCVNEMLRYEVKLIDPVLRCSLIFVNCYL